jgi:large subunit ribosomal protein L10
MALTKQQKEEVVSEVAELLTSAKMTVVAKYQGIGVKAMQQLRANARDNGTRVQVVKNRLMVKALQASDAFKGVDTSELTGMLLYAFNSEDEVAPAKSLAEFAKKNPTLEFVGGITPEGKFISADEVKALAALPSRDEMIAQVIATLNAPLSDSLSGLSGNLHALLDGVSAKAAAAE